MCYSWKTYYFIFLVTISLLHQNLARSGNKLGILDESLDKVENNIDTDSIYADDNEADLFQEKIDKFEALDATNLVHELIPKIKPEDNNKLDDKLHLINDIIPLPVGDSAVDTNKLQQMNQDAIKRLNEASKWFFRGHVPSIFVREEKYDEPPSPTAPRLEVVIDTRKGFNTDETNRFKKNYALLYAQTLEGK